MKCAWVIFFLVITEFFGSLAYAGKASSDLSALDDATRALIMKERARAQVFKGEGEQQTADGEQETKNASQGQGKNTKYIKGGIKTGCNIDIGNTTSKPGANTKPTTVIIDGPVIQMPGKGCP